MKIRSNCGLVSIKSLINNLFENVCSFLRQAPQFRFANGLSLIVRWGHAVPPGQENVGVVGLPEITQLSIVFFYIVSGTLFTDNPTI